MIEPGDYVRYKGDECHGGWIKGSIYQVASIALSENNEGVLEITACGLSEYATRWLYDVELVESSNYGRTIPPWAKEAS